MQVGDLLVPNKGHTDWEYIYILEIDKGRDYVKTITPNHPNDYFFFTHIKDLLVKGKYKIETDKIEKAHFLLTKGRRILGH